MQKMKIIIDEQIAKEISDQFLLSANGKKQQSPKLIAIGGGPGAGKSFLYEQMQAEGRLMQDAVLHDPDLVMQSIPEYREDAKKDPVAAFEKWELPARQLANEILFHAMLSGFHIIYMRSFALPESLQFVQAAKRAGYRFDAHIVKCDLEVAIARAQARERYISPEILMQRHEAVLSLLPEITDLADSYFIYENSRNGFQPELQNHSIP